MVTTGLCECGCGQATRIAPRTARGKGWVKGQPLRYIDKHRQRATGPQYEVVDGGCWDWRWAVDGRGYPAVRVAGRLVKAHRLYFEREHGPIPAGSDIHHRCRNRRCVNPAHLLAIDHAAHARLHHKEDR